ncbi:hypothetical protein GCM10011324_17690 [Allosediminivita pacifica]|nr:hypothetical protein GCM10011324_17690 [Allosediminivita pacifica]
MTDCMAVSSSSRIARPAASSPTGSLKLGDDMTCLFLGIETGNADVPFDSVGRHSVSFNVAYGIAISHTRAIADGAVGPVYVIGWLFWCDTSTREQRCSRQAPGDQRSAAHGARPAP